MRKQLRTVLTLWLLAFFSISAFADDLPETLYMWQASLTTTGNQTADGNDGVYEFTYDYASSTVAPKYWIFTNQSTKAKTLADGGIMYTASSIDEKSNVQPEYGKKYYLTEISSTGDKNTIAENAAICSFLPIYWESVTYKIVVDLNDYSVTFTPTADEETPVTLCLYNLDSTKTISEATISDGKACFSVKFTSDVNIYFAANASGRADSKYHPIWGSSTQANPQIVNVEVNNSYALERTTYNRVVTNSTCLFSVPAGTYDIVADINSGTVEFKDYTGSYRTKPATLYMRTAAFGQAASATGNDGVYNFSYTRTSSTPVYLIFSDVTSYANALSSVWVLGATTEEKNVTPEYGVTYDLVDIDPDKPYSETLCAFAPLSPQYYDITVDLNNLTVVFNTQDDDVDDIKADGTILYTLNDSFIVTGKATKADDGKYHYSLRGKEGDKFFFTTSSTRAGINNYAIVNFGAGGHAAPTEVPVALGGEYQSYPTSYYQVYTMGTDYFVLPGKCDITFDPETKTFAVSEFTAQYCNYPDELYLKLYSSSSTTIYATATGEDGVYTFDYTTQSCASSPRYMIFADNKSLSSASWIVGSSEDGSICHAYPGMSGPLYEVAKDDVIATKGTFMPFYPYSYENITVDLKNMTVKWGEAGELPGTFCFVDDAFGVHSTSSVQEDGVITLEGVTYTSHPLFISDATTRSELQSTEYIYMSTDYETQENTPIADGLKHTAARTHYYQEYYNDGHWITPDGPSKIKAVLDTKDNSIEWSVESYKPDFLEVLYMLDDYYTTIGKCINDKSGIFTYEVKISGTTYVGFSNLEGESSGNGRVFYGASGTYKPSNASYDGKEKNLYFTSQEYFYDRLSAFVLNSGTYRVTVDLNNYKVNFEEISRGDTWYIPESISLVNDDLEAIAIGEPVMAPMESDADDEDEDDATGDEDDATDPSTPDEPAEPEMVATGVFKFTGVTVDKATKVVIKDTADGGKLFGANATGEGNTTAVSGTTYNLYIPKEFYVVNDGQSCFTLNPSTYDITVDFNEKTIEFVDPSIPIYPEEIDMMVPASEEDESDSRYDYEYEYTDGTYVFSVRNTTEGDSVTFYLADPDSGTKYGATVENPEISDGAEVALVVVGDGETPNTMTIPEGVWSVTVDLTNMTVSFEEVPRLYYTSSNHEDGKWYNYFGAGSDPTFRYSFTNSLYSVAGVYVVVGDYESGTPTEGETTALGSYTSAKIDGKDLVLDFTGQTFDLPEGAEPKVHLILTNVRASNGEYVVSAPGHGYGSGTLIFEYDFEEFQRIAIDSKFDLEAGSCIDEITSIGLSLSPYGYVTFDDVVIETAGGDVSIPMEWTVSETDSEGYTAVTAEIPMAIRGLGEVKVYLSNLDVDDNYSDHDGEVAIEYVTNIDPTTVVSSTPEDNSAVEDLLEVTVTWTHPIITSVGNKAQTAYIVNETTGERTECAYSYPDDDNALTLTPTSDITESGNYSLHIEKGDIIFNDDPDTENTSSIVLTFNKIPSTGINGITIGDNDVVEVVDINGIVVRRGVGPDTVRGLNGIYVVNGAKCLLSNGK